LKSSHYITVYAIQAEASLCHYVIMSGRGGDDVVFRGHRESSNITTLGFQAINQWEFFSRG